MQKPHVINLTNAAILIITGVIALILSSSSVTAILAVAGGIVLLLFTRPLQKHNQFAEHTASALTLVLGLVLAFRFDISNFDWSLLSILFLIMCLSCFGAVLLYILNFWQDWQKGRTGL